MSSGAAASASSFLSASIFAGAAEPFHLAAQDNTGRAEDLGVVSKGLDTDPRNAMRIAIVTICTGCETLQQWEREREGEEWGKALRAVCCAGAKT